MKVRWNHEKWGPPPLNLTKDKWYEVDCTSNDILWIFNDILHLYSNKMEYFIAQSTQQKSFECEYGDEHKMNKKELKCKKCNQTFEFNDDSDEICYSCIMKAHFEYVKKLNEEPTQDCVTFKVDKLGWYSGVDCPSDGNSKFDDFEVILIDEITEMIVARDKNKSSLFLFNLKGNCVEDLNWQLYKYLGPELPKEPRKFEFEASITEIDNFNKGIIITQDVEPYSKWKVTMIEVLE